MASFLSGIKNQAMAMVPQLIQTAEPQIEAAISNAMKTMTPAQKATLSTNLNKLNTVVQREATAPPAAPPAMGGRRRKTMKGKKRTHKVKHRKH